MDNQSTTHPGGPEYLEFELPNDQWREVTPPPGARFFAMRVGAFPTFAPSILVGAAELAPGATLVQAADLMLAESQAMGKDTRLVKRDDSAPDRLMQAISLTVILGDRDVEVGQFQTLMELRERTGERRWALAFTLAAAAAEIGGYLADYQAFIGSARGVPQA